MQIVKQICQKDAKRQKDANWDAEMSKDVNFDAEMKNKMQNLI